MGVKSPRPRQVSPAQGSSDRKISPYTFWLQKPVGTQLVEETSGVTSSSPLKVHTWTHILRFTPSELQHWGRSLKGTSGIQKGNEGSGKKVRAGG